MTSSIDTQHVRLSKRTRGGWRMISWCSWDHGKSAYHLAQMGVNWQSTTEKQSLGCSLELAGTL